MSFMPPGRSLRRDPFSQRLNDPADVAVERGSYDAVQRRCGRRGRGRRRLRQRLGEPGDRGAQGPRDVEPGPLGGRRRGRSRPPSPKAWASWPTSWLELDLAGLGVARSGRSAIGVVDLLAERLDAPAVGGPGRRVEQPGRHRRAGGGRRRRIDALDPVDEVERVAFDARRARPARRGSAGPCVSGSRTLCAVARRRPPLAVAGQRRRRGGSCGVRAAGRGGRGARRRRGASDHVERRAARRRPRADGARRAVVTGRVVGARQRQQHVGRTRAAGPGRAGERVARARRSRPARRPAATSARDLAHALRARSGGTSTSAIRAASSAHAACAAATSPRAELGVDQHGEQLGGAQAIVAERPAGRAGPTARARSWSPRARCRRAVGQQRLHELVPARASSCSASTSRPWRTRRSARAMSGATPASASRRRNSLGRATQQRLGLAPAPELDEQRGLHAVAVAGQEHAGPGRRTDQAVAAQQLGPRCRPARSRRRGSRR